MTFVKLIIILALGYFLGSIPFSYLFGEWLGHDDVRKYGSGNVGTTNVMRTFGKKIGILAFLGDFLKGFIAAYIGMCLLGELGMVVAGAASVIGHCYTIFLNFSGGKGVATSAGVIGYVMPIGLVIGLLFFAFIAFFTRYVSLASLSAFVTVFILALVFHESLATILLIAFVGSIAFYRHWGNICRLRQGKERKIGEK